MVPPFSNNCAISHSPMALVVTDWMCCLEHSEGLCSSQRRHSAGINALGAQHNPISSHWVPTGHWQHDKWTQSAQWPCTGHRERS